jgi:hypothetical protein
MIPDCLSGKQNSLKNLNVKIGGETMLFSFLYDRNYPLWINSFRILNQAFYFKLLECDFPEFRNATKCIVVCCSNSACVHFINKICVITFIDEAPNMDETIRQANIEIQGENRNLQALNTSLHEKYHTISLKVHVLDEF